MKINSINNNGFTSKCRIQGSVEDLKAISANIYQNNSKTVMFHPSAIVHPKQKYADVIIANEKDVEKVDKFLEGDLPFDKRFGEFGTKERGENIFRHIWGKEEIKTFDSKNVLQAINNNKFDYSTLDIIG